MKQKRNNKKIKKSTHLSAHAKLREKRSSKIQGRRQNRMRSQR